MLPRSEHESAIEQVEGKIKNLNNCVDDIYNRYVATDIYLEKYLPYNTFVKFIEVLNIALDIDQVKRLENYVAVSL